MASSHSQRKRAYDGRRWDLVVARLKQAEQTNQETAGHLADALRLIESRISKGAGNQTRACC
jgi:hypothetical protein